MKALLVIDMLEDFCNEEGALFVEGARKIIPRLKQEIEKAHKEGYPVIYVCDSHRMCDGEFLIFPAHAVEGTPGQGVVAELAPTSSDYVVRKRRYCGFYQTDLDLLLRELGVDTVILTGVLTDVCVYLTGVSAYYLGYKIEVIEAATEALSEVDKRWALRQMERLFKATIIST